MDGQPGAYGIPARIINVIRLAITAGVVIFAAVTVFLLGTGSVEPTPQLRGSMNLAVLGVCLACATAIQLLRSRRDASPTRARRVTLSIVGWGAGEAAALFSTAATLLTGTLPSLLAGATVMAFALASFPVPPDEA
jgi:hypothetical protein